MASLVDTNYTGADHLEVMREAVNYNRYLLSLVTSRLRPGDKVLDFGAGTGTFALALAERGDDIVCIEPDAGLRTGLQRLGLQAHADISDVPEASCDLVYTFNVLEHIEADQETVRRLARLLKPSGKLVVYVPAFQCLYSAMDRTVGHFRRYRRRGLATLVRNAELSIDAIAYADSIGFFAALAYKVIGNRDGTIDRRSVKLYDRVIFPLSRACDLLLSWWVGKNLVLVASKPMA
jgi:SAM-dependent methyltransferase